MGKPLTSGTRGAWRDFEEAGFSLAMFMSHYIHIMQHVFIESFILWLKGRQPKFFVTNDYNWANTVNECHYRLNIHILKAES